ncbi:Spx/MgsR family RNA polymerase-binding regulatory protein [Roseateles paludis]|uniref:Spx/MgsR family RNA polymerase-binding regulatory protein n=1 Tax=Roseateles paludis TaxID=3145238 RepID=A0ABV0G5L3_9BURK
MVALHPMITVYGIPNCDTVKRARAWLAEAGFEVAFHDFKKAGVPADLAAEWLRIFGRDRVVNRAGTSWRKLDEGTRAGVTDDASALALMQAQPSVIKRPLVRWPDGHWTLGFRAEEFQTGA